MAFSMRALLPVSMLLVAVAPTVFGQAQPDPRNDGQQPVVDALLKIPAPPPSPGLDNREVSGPSERWAFVPAPTDEAPLEQLARYWAGMSTAVNVKPSDRVRLRLVEAIEQHPAMLGDLIDKIPETEESYSRARAVFQRQVAAKSLSEDEVSDIVDVFMLHSRYYRDDLVSKARNVEDKTGKVENAKYLQALARLDWTRARTLVESLASKGGPRVSALAVSLQYEHSLSVGDAPAANTYRQQLRAIAEDRKRSPVARDFAFDALMMSEWPERDAWFLSTFRDPTARDSREDYFGFSFLRPPVRRNPEYWIPKVIPLIGNIDRAVHDGAVDVLVQFYNRDARRDALLPLLPWLSDAKWSDASDRLRLIQSMSFISVPESVPGLIAVLDNDDDWDRSSAADSLGNYRDPRAVPALKRALDKEIAADHRRRIVLALAACGGLDPEWTAAALEAYARFVQTSQGREAISSYEMDLSGKVRIDRDVGVGLLISTRLAPPSEDAVRRILTRAKELQATQPNVAKLMRDTADRWPSPAANLDLLERIAQQLADADAIHAGLQKRKALRETGGGAFARLSDGTGTVAGVAAALSEDAPRMARVLTGTDLAAQAALLASARLVRDQLQTELVEPLMTSSNAQLASAAEAYLISDDRAAARTAVWAKHHGEALILGARQEFDPGHTTYAALDRREDELRQEVLKPGGPTEIFALLSAGYWGSPGQIIVRVYDSKVQVAIERGERSPVTGTLSLSAIADFRRFLESNRIEDLGPLAVSIADGVQYEFVRLRRDGGRRVFMNNPGFSGGSPYDMLCDRVRALAASVSK
jgi:HEAT repeat protein